MSRFLFYSHDSFGLGHLRRTLALARAVVERDPAATALIVTGSSLAGGYRLPPRVDTVKLPCVTKLPSGDYGSLRLGVELHELQRVRANLARAAASSFDPTVAVVDKSPLGLRGELQTTLDTLKRGGRCRLVLGMRDIDDSPSQVRREWRGKRMRQVIRRYYDAVLVYGPKSTMNAIDCMGWEPLDLPIEHVGYVGSPLPSEGPADLPREYLLVTVGGGADGMEVAAAVTEALRLRPLPLPTVIVTGPLMHDEDIRMLQRLAAGLDLRIEEFRPDMEAVIAGASAVVAMAGYNTVSELMHARKRALLVPRVHPREEQLVRARTLAAAGLADMLHPDALGPQAMRAAIDRLLARRPPEPPAEACDGAPRAAEILHALARERALEPALLGNLRSEAVR
jgi:predicted glycosyltransferase